MARRSWHKKWTFRVNATRRRRARRVLGRVERRETHRIDNRRWISPKRVEDARNRADGSIHPTRRLSVRLALRIDDLLELAEHAHAGQHLRQAAVGLALFLDGGDELAILELDAVHGDVDLGHVDLVVLAVAEVVVERLVGAVVADVAEERAARTVVVERQREREDRPAR